MADNKADKTPETAEATERKSPAGRKPATGVRVSARISDELFAKLQNVRWEERYEKVDDLVADILTEGIVARSA